MNDKTYTIDKNVEMPSKQLRGATSPLSIAIRLMEVGDSMLMTQRERNSAFAIAHGIKIRLSSRRVSTPEGGDQIRVWRVS